MAGDSEQGFSSTKGQKQTGCFYVGGDPSPDAAQVPSWDMKTLTDRPSLDPLQLCRPVGWEEMLISSNEEAICGAAADVNSG